MNSYHIVITPDAEADLQILRSHMIHTLSASDPTVKFLHTIKDAILSLQFMPERCAPVPQEPWHTRGVRRLIHRHFSIYYRIERASSQVYILNVILNRRDQLKALKDNSPTI